MKLPLLPEKPPEARETKGHFPSWLHRKLPESNTLWQTHAILEENRMATVCEEARCPNLVECYSKKTATFLAMGKECTRSCPFCSIDFSKAPKPLEEEEPLRMALSVKSLGLTHVVITMVARDDLPDGGAAHLVKIIQKIRELNSYVTIEVLTSDFQGNFAALNTLLTVKPEIFNHNIETVASLSPKVRHKATYQRTLEVLSYVKKSQQTLFVKSGLMLGLGEQEAEVISTLKDLQSTGCDIVTLGQYLQPDRRKLQVKEFILEETFARYAELGQALGIPHIYAGPFVRSSYNAEALFTKIWKNSP